MSKVNSDGNANNKIKTSFEIKASADIPKEKIINFFESSIKYSFFVFI